MPITYHFGHSHNPILDSMITDATKTAEMISLVTTELMLMPLISRINLIEAYYAGVPDTQEVIKNLRQYVRIRQGEFILSQLQSEEA